MPPGGTAVVDPVWRPWRPGDRPAFSCRRDDAVRLPFGHVVCLSQDGISYLAPQIVLLFKAQHDRPKGEADLAGALPLLAPEGRDWLRHALRRVHPGHGWIGML